MERNLTEGNLFKNLLIFGLPYLLSCFLQTFYGMADLFIAGQFNGAATITAISTGSQLTHMLTVIIAGLAMGTTVTISQAVGARDTKKTARAIGNTVSIFIIFAIVMTAVLLCAVNPIIHAVSTPAESVAECRQYLVVCFIGVPFITAYNVISSIFRGLGDSRSPMIFVGIAGVINVVLDYVLIGLFGMGAQGAAIATVTAQAISVILALVALIKFDFGFKIARKDLSFTKNVSSMILGVGLPIACQDGFVQISFLIITAIANSRGVTMAASVGIVEKIITFLFLVNSAMLSSVSAIAAQNIGAGKRDQAKKVLYYGMMITTTFGICAVIVCWIFAPHILALFVKDDAMVVALGAGYLRAYVPDCIFAGLHFCFSGYFCACEKSILSFIHNVIGIICVRIPGAYLTSKLFPATLVPMGMVTPFGSFVSAMICVGLFIWLENREKAKQ